MPIKIDSTSTNYDHKHNNEYDKKHENDIRHLVFKDLFKELIKNKRENNDGK